MSVKKICNTALCCVFLIASTFYSLATIAGESEKVDYLSLTALLIKEGDYIKAGEAIEKVNQQDEKLDKKRFYTLSGLVSLNKELYQKSISSFETAIAKGQSNKVMYVYLAQAYMGLKQYSQVITELEKTAELEKTMPGMWMLRSQAYWLSDEKVKAWIVLNSAQNLFPKNKMFLRNKIFYAIELGLLQEAVDLGKKYIKQYTASVNDYVSLGDALRRSGKPENALKFLELARLEFPTDKNVYLAMAHAYMDMENTYAAATMLEEGGQYHNKLYKDAAELFKQAGDYPRATFNNSKILDQKSKLKQRVALSLEQGHFDQVLAMQDELIRVHLLDEDEFRYVIAYSQFKTGLYSAAEKSLQRITDVKMFRKATQLRKVMTSCADEKWMC
jgi:tetratricopeptide (TPR) repeat protein